MFNKYVYYKYGERGKPEYPEKTSRSMVEIQQTKPTSSPVIHPRDNAPSLIPFFTK